METTKKHKLIITLLSIVVPVVVAVLFGVKIDHTLPVFLPPIYAAINALTAAVLIFAFWTIKNGKKALHEKLMKTALSLSVVFLILYIAHHMTSESTHFGAEGYIKYVYYFILISHIVLSIVVIPLVLITFSRALLGDFKRHKKIARSVFPLWLYVAVSGVLVYIMIAPYY
ncbi:MAG: DUF420 domain-containing protein [Flavobacteriaceae bacterium]|nr:DUF420 domain-containing protein [Flavobacteriaceae bacterium]